MYLGQCMINSGVRLYIGGVKLQRRYFKNNENKLQNHTQQVGNVIYGLFNTADARVEENYK